MAIWYVDIFGQPCRECAFDWSLPLEVADRLADTAAAAYRQELEGRDASLKFADTGWSALGYVWHVVDVLNIWAERVAGIALGSGAPLVPFDENRLADVRGYERLPLASGLWSLSHASGTWQAALQLASNNHVHAMEHPTRGSITLEGVRRWVAHEIAHHGWDIGRAVAVARR